MKKLIVPLMIVLLSSCYYDKEDQLYPLSNSGSGGTCDTTNVTYTAAIQPILAQNCALSGCHDAATKSSGYDLSSYDGAKATANSGRMMGSIKQENGFSPMPKGMTKLNDCNISKISAWINKGMPQ